MTFQGFESKVAFVEISSPPSPQDANKGTKKMTSQELFKSINGKGKKVEHTQEERIAAIVDSMRKFPSWWKNHIAMCELVKSGGVMRLADPWGGYGDYEPSFLIDLWNKAKVA